MLEKICQRYLKKDNYLIFFYKKLFNFYFTGEEKYAPAVTSGPKNCGDVTTEAPDPNNIQIMS